MKHFQITYKTKGGFSFICTPAHDLADAEGWAESEKEGDEEVHSVKPWEEVTNPEAEHEIW